MTTWSSESMESGFSLSLLRPLLVLPTEDEEADGQQHYLKGLRATDSWSTQLTELRGRRVDRRMKACRRLTIELSILHDVSYSVHEAAPQAVGHLDDRLPRALEGPREDLRQPLERAPRLLHQLDDRRRRELERARRGTGDGVERARDERRDRVLDELHRVLQRRPDEASGQLERVVGSAPGDTEEADEGDYEKRRPSEDDED
ncbi:unnamed protein product [Musa acuminata var. zebrina]